MAPRERFELPRDGPTRFPVERNTRLCDLGSYPPVSHFMFNNHASTTSTITDSNLYLYPVFSIIRISFYQRINSVWQEFLGKKEENYKSKYRKL